MPNASAPHFDAITFSGCGTLNFYQTGVAAALQEAELVDGKRFAGASAGSGLATLVAAGVEAGAICQKAVEILEPYAGKNILLRPDVLVTFAESFLEAFVSEDTLSRIGDRVHISITRLQRMQNWQVHRFENTEDLCRAIRASCHIPSPRRRTVKFRGYRCLDGGFSSNTPRIGDRCLAVSPFAVGRHVDIRPQTPLNPARAVVVPSPRQAEELFQLGHADGRRFVTALAGGAKHVPPSSERQSRRKGRAPFLPKL